MKVPRFRRGCLAAACLVALSALPTEGHGQVACRAGPLSTYREASGIACLHVRDSFMSASTFMTPLGLSFWADGVPPLVGDSGLTTPGSANHGATMRRGTRVAPAGMNEGRHVASHPGVER